MKSYIPTKNENFFFHQNTENLTLEIMSSKVIGIFGPIGCGKCSTVLELAARVKDQPVIVVNNLMSETILLQIAQQAMEEGSWLIVDEVESFPVASQGILKFVQDNLNSSTTHKKFRLFIIGTNVPNWFEHVAISMNYLEPIKEAKVLIKCCPEVDLDAANELVSFANEVRQFKNHGIVDFCFSFQTLLNFTKLLFEHRNNYDGFEILYKAAEGSFLLRANEKDSETFKNMLRIKWNKE